MKGQNEKKVFQTDLDNLLAKEKTKSKHRSGQPRQYKDLINRRFDVKVTRIKRRDIKNDIFNEMLDFSEETIQKIKRGRIP
jgi:hypothetical protein